MDERDQFRILDELFRQAVELPPDERRAFVNEACSDKAELLEQLEELLTCDDRLTRVPAEKLERLLFLLRKVVEDGLP